MDSWREDFLSSGRWSTEIATIQSTKFGLYLCLLFDCQTPFMSKFTIIFTSFFNEKLVLHFNVIHFCFFINEHYVLVVIHKYMTIAKHMLQSLISIIFRYVCLF